MFVDDGLDGRKFEIVQHGGHFVSKVFDCFKHGVSLCGVDCVFFMDGIQGVHIDGESFFFMYGQVIQPSFELIEDFKGNFNFFCVEVDIV